MIWKLVETLAVAAAIGPCWILGVLAVSHLRARLRRQS
jgi:hypothetical protein